MTDKRLKRVKLAAKELGTSRSFLYRLVRDGKLTGHRMKSALFISIAEFEQLTEKNNLKSI
jgi:excisionase family DNA binding protein